MSDDYLYFKKDVLYFYYVIYYGEINPTLYVCSVTVIFMSLKASFTFPEFDEKASTVDTNLPPANERFDESEQGRHYEKATNPKVNPKMEIEGIYLLKEDHRIATFDDEEGEAVAEVNTPFKWDSLLDPWFCLAGIKTVDEPDFFSADAEVYDARPLQSGSRARSHNSSFTTRTTETPSNRATRRKHLSKSTMALITGEKYTGTDTEEREGVQPTPKTSSQLGDRAAPDRPKLDQRKTTMEDEELMTIVEKRKPDIPRQISVIRSYVRSSYTRRDVSTRKSSDDDTYDHDTVDESRQNFSDQSFRNKTFSTDFTESTDAEEILRRSRRTKNVDIAKLRQRLAKRSQLVAHRLYSYLNELKEERENEVALLFQSLPLAV
jgi:hypothetical protein